MILLPQTFPLSSTFVVQISKNGIAESSVYKSVILIGTAKFLFKGVVSIYTHTSNVAIFPMALSLGFAIQLLNICNLVDKKIVLCIVLIHVSVIMNKLEQIFICLRAIWIYYFIAHFIGLGYWPIGALDLLRSLPVIWFANICPQFVFNLFFCFTMQKFFSFIQSN